MFCHHNIQADSVLYTHNTHAGCLKREMDNLPCSQASFFKHQCLGHESCRTVISLQMPGNSGKQRKQTETHAIRLAKLHQPTPQVNCVQQAVVYMTAANKDGNTYS